MSSKSESPNARQPDFTLVVNLATPKSDAALQAQDQPSDDSENAALETASDEKNVNVLGQFFRFELYAQQPLTDEHRLNVQNWLTPAIQPLLTLLLSHLPLKLDIVERICLVEPAILGEVIFQVQRENGLKPVYTGQSGYYHTAAKTISYATDEGEVKSTVVCNLDIFGAAIEALRRGNPYSEWAVEEQLSYYVTAHEIGHTLDNWIRKDASTDEVTNLEVVQDWEEISAHYAPMLFHEYLACVYAAKSVTPALQSDMMENWHSDTNNFVVTLNRKRAAFVSDWREVVGCFWILLLQLAKLLGHDTGEQDFPTIVFKEEEWEEEEARNARQSIITELSQTLISFRENYPETPSEEEITEKLLPYFLRLAGSYGYFFRDEDFPSDDPYDEDKPAL